jgi:hypothetical protein
MKSFHFSAWSWFVWSLVFPLSGAAQMALPDVLGEEIEWAIAWRLPMFRFFLFMVGVMAVGTSVAGEVSPCSNTVPIQIMTGDSNDKIEISVAKISDTPPHFRAFVMTVTEHINSRLAKDKFCIKGGDAVSMESAEEGQRSLLQFMYRPLYRSYKLLVPRMTSIGSRSPFSCRIYSPWIDLAIERKPVPQIRGIVRWNDRQLLADQAVLAGAKNVPPGVAIPLTDNEFVTFLGAYESTEISPRPAAQPIEERIPPDILWLLRHTGRGARRARRASSLVYVQRAEDKTIEKSEEGYTKLVLALIDRCFASEGADLRYNSILDAADLIPLEQYRINRLYD